MMWAAFAFVSASIATLVVIAVVLLVIDVVPHPVVRKVLGYVFDVFPRPAITSAGLKRLATRLSGLNCFELPQSLAAGTGLGPEYLHGLEAIVRSVNIECPCDNFGACFILLMVADVLSKRMKVIDHILRYPEILHEPIEPPIIIVGAPRHGTTKLHRTLAGNSELTALSLYELDALFPPTHSPFKLWFQKLAAGFRLGLVRRFATYAQYDSYHTVRLNLPDEDHFLMRLSLFEIAMLSVATHMPSWLKWKQEQLANGRCPNAEVLGTMLKVFTHRHRLNNPTAPRPRFLLKSPTHGRYIPELRRVFPKSHPLVIMRNVNRAFASMCGLWGSARLGILGSNVSSRDLGQDVLNELGWSLKGISHEWQSAHDLTVWLDFKDFVSESRRAEVLPKLFQELGLAYTDEEKLRIEAVMTGPRYGGNAGAKLEEFGLTESSMAEHLQKCGGGVLPFDALAS